MDGWMDTRARACKNICRGIKIAVTEARVPLLVSVFHLTLSLSLSFLRRTAGSIVLFGFDPEEEIGTGMAFERRVKSYRRVFTISIDE